MRVERLVLADVRNHAGTMFETGGLPVVLCGANGAGKTNILEALSLLAPGRGLRGADYETIARHGGGGGFAVNARLHGPLGEARLGVAWPGENGRRMLSLNGERSATFADFADHVRVIWLTPAMDQLFSGPAGDRRRFLDRAITALDPGHGGLVRRHERIMRQRNKLLAEGGTSAWLDAVERQLAETAVALAAGRNTGVETLSRAIAGGRLADAGANPFPWAEIAVDGVVEALVRQHPAVRAEDEYRKMLRDSRSRDEAAGRTLEGPHRSDLKVVHGPKGLAAALCSTGEQKALLISLVLAQARAVRERVGGHGPVMLLDEVNAHLDETRRAGLWREIVRLGCQAWMTGADEALFESCAGAAIMASIADGRIEQQRQL